MLEKKLITESLQKTHCPRCGASLEGAKLITITEAPLALVAHAVCPICKAESMITITPQTDYGAFEAEKFMSATAVTYDELLDLHQALKKKNIWNLLDKKEKKLEKLQKV